MACAYEKMTTAELDAEIARLEKTRDELAAKGLALDMSRGKPGAEQIELSRPMLDVLDSGSDLTDQGQTAANYGLLEGLPSARALAAAILDVSPANVIVSGSSSLNLMHDLAANAFMRGIAGQEPWCRQGEVKFLCPCPGYDRHFAVTESLGIVNVPVAMGPDGPDMDEVERLVEGDPSVKGIWCVPKYANPTGATYSDETVRRFAALKPAASDFRIFWDNAYVVHDLYDEGDELLNIFDAIAEAGGGNLVYEFGSTAKVTFPGSGLAFVAASDEDIAEIRKAFSVMRVGPEKLTQLMHARWLPDMDAVRAQMKRQAQIIRPRFEMVTERLESELGELGVATWTNPRGGYFISFDGMPGTAKAIVGLARDLGVTLTGAGAAFPYGQDPLDANIRIAPTFPSMEELSAALDVFVLAVKLVSAQHVRAGRE